MGYYKELVIEQMSLNISRHPNIGSLIQIDDFWEISKVALYKPKEVKMQLEEILIKMFYSAESGDFQTYRELREIAIDIIKNRNKESYLH